MSEWIKLYASAFTHPKTRRVAKRLGVSPAAVVGHMAALWSFTAEFAPDGDLSRFDDEEVELGAGWDGDDGAFVDAAKVSGYLDDEDGVLSVHDWSDYGGKLVAMRAADRKRKAASRKSEGCPADVQRTASRARAGQREEREEREEKEEKEHMPADAGVFDSFYDVYPRKIARQKALRAWRARLKDGHSAADMTTAARVYADHCRRNHTEPRFIQHPATFIGVDVPYVEWLHGVPISEQASGNGGRSGRQLDTSLGVLKEVMADLQSEA